MSAPQECKTGACVCKEGSQPVLQGAAAAWILSHALQAVALAGMP